MFVKVLKIDWKDTHQIHDGGGLVEGQKRKWGDTKEDINSTPAIVFLLFNKMKET